MFYYSRYYYHMIVVGCQKSKLKHRTTRSFFIFLLGH